MKRFRVIIERPAAEDLDDYYQRAAAAGAGSSAARWFNRIVAVILSLEEAPKWRAPVPEQGDFEETLYQVIFERRYRIIYTVIGNRVHVLCVRGPGMREIGPASIRWPGPEDEPG